MPDTRIDPKLILNDRLTRLVTQIGTPVVRLCEGRFGITRREWRFLSVLARDGGLSPPALVDRAGRDCARVSRVFGSMTGKDERALQGLSPEQRRQFDDWIERLTRQTADFKRELVTEYPANRRTGRARRPHGSEGSGQDG